MAFIQFKLGKTGAEIGFTLNASEYVINPGGVENVQRVLDGNLTMSVLKALTPDISIAGDDLSQTNYNKFLSLLVYMAKTGIFLNFIPGQADTDMKIIDEPSTSTAANKVKIIKTSCSGITILGVWLAADTNHAGTNYYTGGSFDSSTYEITLGSSLPGANSDVIIDWKYSGWKVKPVFSFTPIRPWLSDDYIWSFSIRMIGV